MQPAAIGLDFFFVASQGPERDFAMLTALRDIDRPVVVGAVDQHTNEFDTEQLAYQQQFLAQVDRPKGYLALDYGPNHIVRRTSPPLADSPFQESFARQVAVAAGAPLTGPGTSSASTRIAWLEGPNHDTEPFFRISAKELLHGTTDARRAEIAQRIQGNVVLTGIAMPNSDWHDTALSVWTDQKMLGVMVHAHVLAQLLDGRYFYELDARARGILLIVVGVAGLVLAWALGERRASLLNLGLATAVLVAIDALCYLGLPPRAAVHPDPARVVHRCAGRASPAHSGAVGRSAHPASRRRKGPEAALRAAGRSGSGSRCWRGRRRSTAPACGAGSCAPGARRRAPPTR